MFSEKYSQTDGQSSPCKHGKIIDKYIDKIRTMKKSAKFNLLIQCNYRQSLGEIIV